MFDIGWSEATVILMLALLLFGPDKLAEFAKTLGKLYGEYKAAKRRLELELLYGKEVLSKNSLKDLAKSELMLTGNLEEDFAEIVDFTANNSLSEANTAGSETVSPNSSNPNTSSHKSCLKSQELDDRVKSKKKSD